jgi:hypothetical protein
MNIAVYLGPVPRGVGYVLILWGFPNLAPPPRAINPNATAAPTLKPGDLDDFTRQMLWTDGLRMLQGTVLDITCNVGTTDQQAFTVGGKPGIGTFFNVSQCQGEVDTAGWFVGTQQFGRSYLFYVYAEPVEAYNESRATLQQILDSVVFEPPPTPSPTVTP